MSKYRSESDEIWAYDYPPPILKPVKRFAVDPWWITGFVDAQSCFFLKFRPYRNWRKGFAVKPMFRVAMIWQSVWALYLIEDYFRPVGWVKYNLLLKYYAYYFTIDVIAEMDYKLFPHFEQYPLVCPRTYQDYSLFKAGVDILRRRPASVPPVPVRHRDIYMCSQPIYDLDEGFIKLASPEDQYAIGKLMLSMVESGNTTRIKAQVIMYLKYLDGLKK